MKNTLKIYIIISISLLSTSIYAQTSEFKISDIKIQGLKNVLKQSVLNNLNVKSGDILTTEKSNDILNDLYAIDYFSDIKLIKKDNNLIINLTEQSAISEVNINGNSTIKTSDLKKGLTENGLEVGNILDENLLSTIEKSLLEQYYALGKYGAKVSFYVTKLPRNRVKIDLNIAEGKTAEIERIDFVGNKKINDKIIKNNIILTTPSIWNLWGLFTSDDKYSTQKMQGSLEQLRSYYMDNGYLDFLIDSSQVALTPNKEETYITMNLNEGDIYKITDVSIQGDLIIPKKEAMSLIKLKSGDIFSRKKLIESAEAIKSKLSNKGYAFAEVNPIPKIDKEKHTVGIIFLVNPGKQVVIRNITFKGNNTTNDYVFRRLMQLYEGAMYNDYYLEQSKIKLQRLPYLEGVDVRRVPVPGIDDLIDLEYNLKEKSANTISGSLGYSQLYDFIIGANLTFPNWLGTGNSLSLSTQLSYAYRNLSLSYTDPFFTVSGISQTISFNVSDIRTSFTDLTRFNRSIYSANVNYGVPVSINDTVFFGYGAEHNIITEAEGDNASLTIAKFMKDSGSDGKFNNVNLNLGWSRDTTNRAYFATEGAYTSLVGQATVPGSTATWYKISATQQWNQSVTENSIFTIKAGADYGNGYGGTPVLPFYQNYYSGGWGSVRGFVPGTLGPRDKLSDGSQGFSLGGNLNVYASFDLLFSMPGLADTGNVKLGIFTDIGNVYDTEDFDITSGGNPSRPTLKNLQASAGIEVLWLSPVGAIGVSFSKAIQKNSTSDTEFFQFTIGQGF